MFELIQLNEKNYYINCPAKIGIYKPDESGVYLIDSGNDKDAGRKIRKILDENSWTLKGIINTHSNADHIGGNKYLQQQTGCKIFSGGIEAAFTENPILEPSFLYGGYPFKDLKHKFLLAAESKISNFSDSDFPDDIEIIPLKGHFFDMVGFRTADNIVYLADCLSSRETLEKYKISFIYDVKEYLHTLEMVKNLEADMFVPSHAPAAKDIKELAQYNIDNVNEIADDIMKLCEQPKSFEAVLQALFTSYGLTMNFEQHILVGSTIRSYLSYLKDNNLINAYFENNIMLWKKI